MICRRDIFGQVKIMNALSMGDIRNANIEMIRQARQYRINASENVAQRRRICHIYRSDLMREGFRVSSTIHTNYNKFAID